MGDSAGAQGSSVEETVRRARDEMHSVTASLRALLQDLREGRAAAYRRSKPRKRSQSVTAAS